MSGDEIREQFLKYFELKGHLRVSSSPLVPANDPTLLFTNAGMNQFKEVFLGEDLRNYARATTSQKCVRAGGKHNDLENVGRTRRHHTFFEMLGNFSFGDYFKKEAIEYAWDLVTKVYGLPEERLYVTIFRDDDEAEQLWKQVTSIGSNRIFRCDEKDNFWQMGDVGPCGPCSEIFYDYGPEGLESGEEDEPFPADTSRYVEIWNLVFMQFDRDSEGNLHPLPKPSIDTGMGLERLAAVLQGKLSNYETDLFSPLIQRSGELLGVRYGKSNDTDVMLRIVADHGRATAFLVHDNVMPSNEGRGYVLRKIMRRALRHARLAGFEGLFFHELTSFVADFMKAGYPGLQESKERVARIVREEEFRYQRNFVIAEREFEGVLSNVEDGSIPGTDAFRLYDTFGLSLDEQQEMARERGFVIDLQGFDETMEQQRTRAQASWKGMARPGGGMLPVLTKLREKGNTEFIGYKITSADDLQVVGLLQGDKQVDRVQAGSEAGIILDRTTFYAESGGQVGDHGVLLQGALEVARIHDVQAPLRGISVHRADILQDIAVGDRLVGRVDDSLRDDSRRNHTATHLMHAALRKILGPHVKQAGSVVAPDRLRFDVTHYAPLEPGEIEEVEQLVNNQILEDSEVVTDVWDLDSAVKSGAMALFGEKYQDKVRVVSIGDFSKELCGGTHVARTGEIGVFKIISESSSAAGVRRLEALTGHGAYLQYSDALQNIDRMANLLRVTDKGLVDALQALISDHRRQEKTIDSLQAKLVQSNVDELVPRARDILGMKVLVARLEGVEKNHLRSLADSLRNKIGSGLVVLGTTDQGKVSLIAAATKDVSGSKVHAGNIVKSVAELVGGGGGGRADLAEAGGRNPEQLDHALEQVYEFVKEQVKE